MHYFFFQWWISSTFYARLLHRKALCAAFLWLHFGFVLFLPKILAKRCQFHQNFMCAFCVIREKQRKALSFAKRARKMLMKLTAEVLSEYNKIHALSWVPDSLFCIRISITENYTSLFVIQILITFMPVEH